MRNLSDERLEEALQLMIELMHELEAAGKRGTEDYRSTEQKVEEIKYEQRRREQAVIDGRRGLH